MNGEAFEPYIGRGPRRIEADFHALRVELAKLVEAMGKERSDRFTQDGQIALGRARRFIRRGFK